MYYIRLPLKFNIQVGTPKPPVETQKDIARQLKRGPPSHQAIRRKPTSKQKHTNSLDDRQNPFRKGLTMGFLAIAAPTSTSYILCQPFGIKGFFGASLPTI